MLLNRSKSYGLPALFWTLWVFASACGGDDGAGDPQVALMPDTQATGGTVALGTGGTRGGTGGASSMGSGGVPVGSGEFPQAGGTGGTPEAGGDSAWCDAFAVMRNACHTCHGPEPVGAPMPLASWEDTQALSVLDQTTPIYEVIGQRIHDDARPMPPVSQEPLDAAQKQTIDAWIAAGAPSAADPTCGFVDESPTAGEDFEWPADCEERFEFVANDGTGGPHVVRANSETHPQFNFEVPWGGSGPVQAVAVKPITDNKRVLHHWILYQGQNFLTGWAPGNDGHSLESNVGTYMPENGQMRLDIHYYNLGNPQDEPDQSGVEICITHTLREHTSVTYPFTAPATAPASQRVENQDTCTVVTSEPVFLTASSPHMHQLGVHAKLEVIRTDGTVEVLHDLPFSFEDQIPRSLPNVQLNNGDRVRTTCVFENPSSRNVAFGLGSDDEMCFNFATYYPMCALQCTPTDPISAVIAASQGGGCPTGGGLGFGGF